MPAQRPTCPAFGGEGLRTLYVTTARAGLDADDLASQPHAGGVFSIVADVPGLPDGEVRL